MAADIARAAVLGAVWFPVLVALSRDKSRGMDEVVRARRERIRARGW